MEIEALRIDFSSEQSCNTHKTYLECNGKFEFTVEEFLNSNFSRSIGSRDALSLLRSVSLTLAGRR